MFHLCAFRLWLLKKSVLIGVPPPCSRPSRQVRVEFLGWRPAAAPGFFAAMKQVKTLWSVSVQIACWRGSPPEPRVTGGADRLLLKKVPIYMTVLKSNKSTHRHGMSLQVSA
jgi:hypothetical protein